MIKGNCVQTVVPRRGKKFQFFWAVTVPMLINRKDVVSFILGNLSPVFCNASVLRIVMAFLFGVLRKTDQWTAKNDLE